MRSNFCFKLVRIKKGNFLRGEEYPSVDPKSTKCELYDLKEKKLIEIKKDKFGRSYDLDSLNPKGFSHGLSSLNTEFAMLGNSGKGSAPVELIHFGAVQLLETNGFVAQNTSLNGLLVPGVAEKISMRFAIMDPKMSPPTEEGGIFSVPDVVYSLRDPYFFPIKETPTVLREFQLNCSIAK